MARLQAAAISMNFFASGRLESGWMRVGTTSPSNVRRESGRNRIVSSPSSVGVMSMSRPSGLTQTAWKITSRYQPGRSRMSQPCWMSPPSVRYLLTDVDEAVSMDRRQGRADRHIDRLGRGVDLPAEGQDLGRDSLRGRRHKHACVSPW